LVLVYQILSTILGAIILCGSLLGMVLAARLLWREPFWLLFFVPILYRIALVGSLQWQPRHMNDVYPFMIPFFLKFLDVLTPWSSAVRRFLVSRA
jgi:hypothetical protein